jgi:16S rRNA (guanine527-N7)-methyltransferase
VIPDALRTVLEDAQRVGLLGPGPVEDHVGHAEAWAEVVAPGRFLDLGSGAGIPGLVLALAWPTVSGALLDGQTRRTAWLRTALARLQLTDRISVVEGRAQDLGHDAALRERFDVVVARGFGPPPVTAECGAAFTAVGGVLSVSEPPEPPDRWPAEALARVGLGIPRQVVHGGASFVILPKDSALAGDFPRRRNVPVRNPLW